MNEPSSSTVLILDDDVASVAELTLGLEGVGFKVETSTDGAQAVTMVQRIRPDVILLDLMHAPLSGIDVCRQLRAHTALPIIIVSAKATEIDIVVGLELGADDYLPKPAHLHELVARIRAVLRRSRGELATLLCSDADRWLQVGDVRLNPSTHEVIVRGCLVPMHLKEFELLKLLLSNAGRVLSRATIVEVVWGADQLGRRSIPVRSVQRLRANIELNPAVPVRITTVRGIGYKYEKPAEHQEM